MVAERLKYKTEWGYLNILVHFVSLKLRTLKTGNVTKCATNYVKYKLRRLLEIPSKRNSFKCICGW